MEKIITEIKRAAEKFKAFVAGASGDRGNVNSGNHDNHINGTGVDSNDTSCNNANDGGKIIRIITHYDADGVSSGAILAKALQRLDCKFWLTMVKQLERNVLEPLVTDAEKGKFDAIFFLDLSGNFELINKIANANVKVFILDHHESDIDFGSNANKGLSKNITLVNPVLFAQAAQTNKEEISGAGLAYLFAKELNAQNKDLAQLAILGMIGDILGESISKIYNLILKDSDVIVRRNLPLLFSTRPLHKALEYSSGIFIPGVTGSREGVMNLLRETGIKADYSKTLLNLTHGELSSLVTAIMLRRAQNGSSDSILGNIYIMKFFNRTEDARELTALLNACGKLGHGEIALALCLGSSEAKEEAESIYSEYKGHIVAGLNHIRALDSKDSNKRENERYAIHNCKNYVKDSLIGVITSILALSSLYPSGKVLIGMAYRDDAKIKVSARISRNKHMGWQGKQDKQGDQGKQGGQNEINLKELLHKVCKNASIDGESGGHVAAAGCLVPVAQEDTFINALEQELKQLK